MSFFERKLQTLKPVPHAPDADLNLALDRKPLLQFFECCIWMGGHPRAQCFIMGCKLRFASSPAEARCRLRETAEAIEASRSKGVLAVEMEAAALYTLASATRRQVLCIAHVTNTMGQAGQDFEKGEADGTADSLSILERIVATV